MAAQWQPKIDPTAIVDGNYWRYVGGKVVGVNGLVNQAALDAVAASLASETAARQAADATLATAIAGKAATVHTHAAADIVSGIVTPTRLGTGTADATTVLYGDSVYRTVPAGYTDEMVDDRVATLLVDGDGNPFSYDDASGTLTIEAGGGIAIGNAITGGTAGRVLVVGAGGVLAQAFRTDTAGRHILITNTGTDRAGLQFDSLGSTAGGSMGYGFSVFHDRQAGADDLRISAWNAGVETLVLHSSVRGQFIGIGGASSGSGYVTINPKAGAPTLPPLAIGTNDSAQAPSARFVGYSSDGVDGGGGIEIGSGVGSVVYCRWFRTDTNSFRITTGSPGAGDLDLMPKGRLGVKSPLVFLANSSTQERQTGLIDRSWFVDTDASRLGELVGYSSGYNGDHVGWRVRDNGSGADVLLDSIREAANDTAAAALSPSVPIDGLYRFGSDLKIRVS